LIYRIVQLTTKTFIFQLTTIPSQHALHALHLLPGSDCDNSRRSGCLPVAIRLDGASFVSIGCLKHTVSELERSVVPTNDLSVIHNDKHNTPELELRANDCARYANKLYRILHNRR
jgi:hypothetical protein